MRWSMMRGGTLPGRNPWIGTSTVNRTRVGVRVSTALFTVVRLLGRSVGGCAAGPVRQMVVGAGAVQHRRLAGREGPVVGAGRLELPISCTQSRRASHYATPREASQNCHG